LLAGLFYTGRKKNSISSPSVEKDKQDEGTNTVASSGGSTSVISTEDTTDKVVDDNYYAFRGFLAWCLWGWIPFEMGAKIKSSLFADGKANASYGRKTMLQQALKSRCNACTSICQHRGAYCAMHSTSTRCCHKLRCCEAELQS
jgi:hypothetical protein